MSSRRYRDRSRSPPPASDGRDRSPSPEATGRSGRHRAYRQRDDYDRDDYDGNSYDGGSYGRDDYDREDYDRDSHDRDSHDRDSHDDEYEQHGYDNNNQPRHVSHDSSTVITGRNPTVTVNYFFEGATPPDNAPRGYMPPRVSHIGNDGRHFRMFQWGPGSSIQRGQPKKQIPEAMRDKCGACREDHDIRFCPYPNTEDGRTKICPICDTSKHAWYQCVHYEEDDTHLQWEICWVNRRCLPTLVHDHSLHGIFLKKLNLEDEETPFEIRLLVLNTEAGPLSPAFVKRLLPPNGSDSCVQQQLWIGRQLPWQLDKDILESSMFRPEWAIEDPATKDMQVGNFIPDTKTSYVPKAGKQEYFKSLDRKKRNGEDM
ncbi:hypothetical protein KVR01_013218 [Diaporthe batatas]|uniref:uncharacterized protein n=1 Tax=Diaporthe batatas TaxID=748121 RepID=UPI001D04C6FF|nr:uncharacterized protein KVR01_013218 [Diaporthe batatas]KAG8156996.1 hypothetical protein KVR01_013218 [Diaporthe batatas]